MKKVLISILMTVVYFPANAQSFTASDSLPDVSLMRPTHVISEDIRWNRASPDLFTFWIDNGVYGFYGPQPKILMDGLPIDANFFGWQNLNMLPIVHLGAREFKLNPGIFNNTVSPAGAINFKYSQPDSGLYAETSFFAGNETGDPGPYVYDSLKTTPNIDRWGPDGELFLSYRNNNWYSKGVFTIRNHLPTDLASNTRLHFTASQLGTNNRYVNHPPRTFTQSGLFETGYDAPQWDIRARAAYGQSHDYLFLQPFGREVPAKTAYRQLAFEGNYQIESWKFSGRYTGHQKTMDKRIDLHTYIFDWDQRSHTVGLTGTYNSEELELKPGLIYERLITRAPGLGETPNDLITLSLDASTPFSNTSSLKMHVNADYDEERIAKTYQFKFPTDLTPNWRINPEFLHTEVLPVRQHAFSYWVNRGYSFADELNIPYSNSVSVSKNKLTAYKLQNRIAFSPEFSLVLEQQLIDHQALNIPFQEVESNEFITDTQPGRFSSTPERGNRLKLFAELRYSLNDVFQQSLAVIFQKSLSGSERYRNYFEQVPETKLMYQMDVQPVPTLIVTVNALYRSSTHWNEFEAIEGNEYRLPNGIPIREVTGIFQTETPAFADLSLSVQKLFWDQRLSTAFSIRNLLNEELRMHPLGADLNTQFNIEIGLKL